MAELQIIFVIVIIALGVGLVWSQFKEHEDYDEEMFEVFALLHPVEAYDLDRKAFHKFMKKKMPELSKKTIDKLMVETKAEIEAPKSI